MGFFCFFGTTIPAVETYDAITLFIDEVCMPGSNNGCGTTASCLSVGFYIELVAATLFELNVDMLLCYITFA